MKTQQLNVGWVVFYRKDFPRNILLEQQPGGSQASVDRKHRTKQILNSPDLILEYLERGVELRSAPHSTQVVFPFSLLLFPLGYKWRRRNQMTILKRSSD